MMIKLYHILLLWLSRGFSESMEFVGIVVGIVSPVAGLISNSSKTAKKDIDTTRPPP